MLSEKDDPLLCSLRVFVILLINKINLQFKLLLLRTHLHLISILLRYHLPRLQICLLHD